MNKAAAIGCYDSIYGFQAAGIDIFAVNTEEECAESFKKAINGRYGIVFITEQFADNSFVRAHMTLPIPAVMVIPDASGSTGYAIKELHSMVEKAAGADLL